MKSRASTLPAWLEDERSLLEYLVRPHDGHAYPEDLIDAVALMTSWLMVAMAVLAVVAVLVERFLRY